MRSLHRAVLATLTYSDHFGFPLTAKELRRRLISTSTTSTQLSATLAPLLKSGRIAKSGPYYHLPGKSHLVARRRRRANSSRAHLARLKILLPRLTRVPGVMGLYLTGALAVNNSPRDDDYDLLVVTRPGLLWTTRLLLTLTTQLLGLRRRAPSVAPWAKWGTPPSSAGKLCLNLYLDTSSYKLPASRQNLYTAYELVQTRPLYDPHRLYPQLLAANPWIRNYLPNFPFPSSPPSFIIHHSSFIGSLFEKFAFWTQYQYMKKKISRELITPHAAFFHPRDPGKQILKVLNFDH